MSLIELFLASKSPRRRELLTQMGVRYQCVGVNVPELREPDETPAAYVNRLAISKASAGFVAGDSVHPALGSDTIVVCGQQVLEKPHSEGNAVEMLLTLSGCQHQVLTAVAVCLGERCEVICQTTRVTFRTITQSEARAYWASGEPGDKAGAYGIQGLGGIFVERIEGSYSGVMGLPVFETWQLLKAFDVPVWQTVGNQPDHE